MLTSQPEGPVVVDLAADGKVVLDVSGCTDGEGSATCLLFEPNKWNVPQTVHYTSTGPGVVHHSVASADRVYAGVKVHEVGIDAVYSIFMPLARR